VRKLTVRLTDRQHAALARRAQAAGVTVAELVRSRLAA
jgi:hypothetical protein